MTESVVYLGFMAFDADLSALAGYLDAGLSAGIRGFAERPHVLQAFLASVSTWGMSALGADAVFLPSG